MIDIFDASNQRKAETAVTFRHFHRAGGFMQHHHSKQSRGKNENIKSFKSKPVYFPTGSAWTTFTRAAEAGPATTVVAWTMQMCCTTTASIKTVTLTPPPPDPFRLAPSCRCLEEDSPPYKQPSLRVVRAAQAGKRDTRESERQGMLLVLVGPAFHAGWRSRTCSALLVSYRSHAEGRGNHRPGISDVA